MYSVFVTISENRIIPKYHEEITGMVTRENLSAIWTTERTVEYLLLSGLICETAWFAHKMGDWKTGFLLSVSHTSHRQIAPHLYVKYGSLSTSEHSERLVVKIRTGKV